MNAFKRFDGVQLLDEAPVVIEKLGGDQTPKFRENAERIEQNHRDGKKQVIVLSALKKDSFNTTSNFIQFADQLREGQSDEARATLERLRTFHQEMITSEEVEEEHQGALLEVLDRMLAPLEQLIGSSGLRHIKDGEDRLWIDAKGQEQTITGYGEKIVEQLYHTYLRSRGSQVKGLAEANETHETVQDVRKSLHGRLLATLEDPTAIPVMGGYLRHFAKKRNYSELTMIELAIAGEKEGLETLAHVVKEVPILSADPKSLTKGVKPQLVSQMSQRRAGELFGVRGGQAGAIHSDVMARLTDENSQVPIVVSNPRKPELGSTTIHPAAHNIEGQAIVASKKAPAMLIIEGPMSADSGVVHEITGTLLKNVVDQIFSTNNGLVITLNKAVDENKRLEIEAALKAQHPSYQVKNETNTAVVIALGAEKIRGKKDALQDAGISIPFSNESNDAGFACFVVPSDQVKIAVNTLHELLYEYLPNEVQPSAPWFISPEQAFEINKQFAGPTYVYSEERIREAAQQVLAFQNAYGFTARYAMKANPHREFLEMFNKMGIQIDASSGFEAARAILAGVPVNQILLTSQELSEDFEDLVKQGVEFNACSLEQLEAYGEAFPGSELSLRFNPGVGSGGNARTNVGDEESSFGIWHEDMDKVKAIIERHGLKVKRVHTHIGSGTDPEIWTAVAELSIALMDNFPEASILNLGGGFKVARTTDEKATDLQEVSERIKTIFEAYKARTGREIHLEIEPGTYLMANGGVLLTDVMEVHSTTQDNRFIKARTGMTEIIRPTLYGAPHPITIFQRDPNEVTVGYYVVGRNCESGDQLTTVKADGGKARPRWLPEAHKGDLIVVGGTGAYCASMSTKGYNSFPEAAEVLMLADGTYKLISRRGTLADLMAREL